MDVGEVWDCPHCGGSLCLYWEPAGPGDDWWVCNACDWEGTTTLVLDKEQDR